MEYIKRAYKADLNELERVTEDLGEVLKRHGASLKGVYDLSTVIEEVFSYVAVYACPLKEDKICQIDMTFRGGNVIIDFIDEGEEMDFNNEEGVLPADKGARALARPLIEHCIDDCHYERRHDRNIFTIIKRIKEN